MRYNRKLRLYTRDNKGCSIAFLFSTRPVSVCKERNKMSRVLGQLVVARHDSQTRKDICKVFERDVQESSSMLTQTNCFSEGSHHFCPQKVGLLTSTLAVLLVNTALKLLEGKRPTQAQYAGDTGRILRHTVHGDMLVNHMSEVPEIFLGAHTGVDLSWSRGALECNFILYGQNLCGLLAKVETPVKMKATALFSLYCPFIRELGGCDTADRTWRQQTKKATYRFSSKASPIAMRWLRS